MFDTSSSSFFMLLLNIEFVLTLAIKFRFRSFCDKAETNDLCELAFMRALFSILFDIVSKSGGGGGLVLIILPELGVY